MRNVYKALGLFLLLLTAQQGAVVHELSHLSGTDRVQVRDAGAAAETPCALCPAFAQVVTPAFSHSLQIPRLVAAESQFVAEPQFIVVDASVPRPRSRGPPSLS
ncbi:MAG: hypothetical protein WBF89_04915 [Steroidobacteraceae bacterium]